jgi:hypothetical protein
MRSSCHDDVGLVYMRQRSTLDLHTSIISARKAKPQMLNMCQNPKNFISMPISSPSFYKCNAFPQPKLFLPSDPFPANITPLLASDLGPPLPISRTPIPNSQSRSYWLKSHSNYCTIKICSLFTCCIIAEFGDRMNYYGIDEGETEAKLIGDGML